MARLDINWRRATIADARAMGDLIYNSAGEEMEDIYNINIYKVYRDIAIALIQQDFDPRTQMLAIAEVDGAMVGWSWVVRNGYTFWSEDESAEMRIVQCQSDLPTRLKVKFVNAALDMSELWAQLQRIPVMISGCIMRNYLGYVKLHLRRGYTARGSMCYKRFKA